LKKKRGINVATLKKRGQPAGKNNEKEDRPQKRKGQTET